MIDNSIPPSASVQHSEKEGVCIIQVKGYCETQAGENILKIVEQRLRNQCVCFVIDFTECTIINSPGISKLGEVSQKIVEDFQGRLFLTTSNPLIKRVFEVSGLTLEAQVAANVDEALKWIKSQF